MKGANNAIYPGIRRQKESELLSCQKATKAVCKRIARPHIHSEPKAIPG